MFRNPGPPIVTSNGGRDAVVWVLDANAARTEALVPREDRPAPRPVLYAFDATTMESIGRVELAQTGGKYTHPTVAHGVVYAVTDRVVAYGAAQ